MTQTDQDPAAEAYLADYRQLCARIDRGMLAMLLALAAVALALAWLYTPLAWAGTDTSPHVHLLATLLIAGSCCGAVGWLVKQQPGERLTRHVVGASVMLMSALFIHLGGGRIEVHFTVFVGLAFLAAYRDWQVMITGMVTAAVDHVARGLLAPRSVFGVDEVDLLRIFEHAGYVVLEVSVLVLVCRMSISEMQRVVRLILDANEAHDRAERAQQQLNSQVEAARQEAAARVQSIVDQFHSVGGYIDENAQQTRQLQSIGETSQQHAAAGGEVLARTVSLLDELAKAVRESQDSIQALVEAGSQIAQVTSTISSVAFQTNLLALNAAVEAARAGEHGKGFAVVAEEVRALSARTSDATRQIEEFAQKVQQRGAELAEVTRRANEEAREGLSLIDDAENSIRSIQGSADELGGVVDDALQANARLLAKSQQLQHEVEALVV